MSVSLQCCSLMSVLLQCCSLMSVLLQCCVCYECSLAGPGDVCSGVYSDCDSKMWDDVTRRHFI